MSDLENSVLHLIVDALAQGLQDRLDHWDAALTKRMKTCKTEMDYAKTIMDARRSMAAIQSSMQQMKLLVEIREQAVTAITTLVDDLQTSWLEQAQRSPNREFAMRVHKQHPLNAALDQVAETSRIQAGQGSRPVSATLHKKSSGARSLLLPPN